MTPVRVISSLVAWLLVSVALWLSDAEPSVIALAGVVAVVAALGLVVFDLSAIAQSIRWPQPADPEPSGGPLAERIPRPLREIHVSIRSHPDGLRPRLIALVDQRLLNGHGIDRLAEPIMADDLLTPELHELVTSTAGRIRNSVDLSRLIDEIEAL